MATSATTTPSLMTKRAPNVAHVHVVPNDNTDTNDSNTSAAHTNGHVTQTHDTQRSTDNRDYHIHDNNTNSTDNSNAHHNGDHGGSSDSYDATDYRVIILRGISGSGKSRLARAIAATGLSPIAAHQANASLAGGSLWNGYDGGGVMAAMWTCSVCTYSDNAGERQKCEMCNTPRVNQPADNGNDDEKEKKQQRENASVVSTLSASTIRALQSFNNDRGRLPSTPTCVLISADDFFINDSTGRYEFRGAQVGQAHATAQTKYIDALVNNVATIVIDNTATQRWEYAVYQKLAHAFGYTCDVVEIACTDENMLSLYQQRCIHRVPAATMTSMYQRFEHDPHAIVLAPYVSDDERNQLKVVYQSLAAAKPSPSGRHMTSGSASSSTGSLIGDRNIGARGFTSARSSTHSLGYNTNTNNHGSGTTKLAPVLSPQTKPIAAPPGFVGRLSQQPSMTVSPTNAKDQQQQVHVVSPSSRSESIIAAPRLAATSSAVAALPLLHTLLTTSVPATASLSASGASTSGGTVGSSLFSLAPSRLGSWDNVFAISPNSPKPPNAFSFSIPAVPISSPSPSSSSPPSSLSLVTGSSVPSSTAAVSIRSPSSATASALSPSASSRAPTISAPAAIAATAATASLASIHSSMTASNGSITIGTQSQSAGVTSSPSISLSSVRSLKRSSAPIVTDDDDMVTPSPMKVHVHAPPASDPVMPSVISAQDIKITATTNGTPAAAAAAVAAVPALPLPSASPTSSLLLDDHIDIGDPSSGVTDASEEDLLDYEDVMGTA